ncbi:MAG: phosphomethylpyrimidine synthase ThiC [Kiritimatiellia bacterium]|jgi:phosphomethylpyrimidine synthase|nr:phosphomethylpyrimidine synthase ThiC [Kiritimatiellia bacterium]MDP6810850.1 phosphomethylpyrimidine synthase ThiC [Kiritimatiellia bacterium]MDP7024193.1 phosphomethylpyrimidine synthase ThiC [Kiritimatiellia bacterium]
MSTQLLRARDGAVTAQMEAVAVKENVPVDEVRALLASGRAVLPANPAHTRLSPEVVGRRFRTKVNANLGRSADKSCLEEEQTKVTTALEAGADFVMDLSVGPDLGALRRGLLDICPAPFGTVPIYEALSRIDGNTDAISSELMLTVIRDQAEQGVDFMTIHAGLLRSHVDLALKRIMGIASRGGAILARWMAKHDQENPLYTNWDAILDICREHDVTLSLGDGLRPGCLADASDDAQFAELDVLGELVTRSREAGVQVMVEGPGHVPFDQIQMNMEREQRVCDEAPFYVLGPVVTDIAPGYDHITSAIGATAAAFHGASLLCYVTPAEHLGLPTAKDVKEGVIAYRIAAHAADVARGLPGARERDDAMSRARRAFDWDQQFDLALDGEGARARYEAARVESDDDESDFCSMCGKDFCAVRNTQQILDEQ